MRNRTWLAALLLLALAAPAFAQQKPASSGFTLQQILSAPFPSSLIAAPAKGRFAWVFNAEGRRNVWIAEPAASGGGYTARALTHYTADDGQDVSDLAWTPDGEALLYVRGGDFEYPTKAYPNPASNPEGVEQAVWFVSLSGGEPRKIGEGHAPAVSPKGNLVAYLLKGDIWLAALDGSGKPQQLHVRGESGSLRWSPDGASLAFVSDRGDYSFIAVYAPAAKTVTYLDPGSDHDLEPAWSPDSARIAFLRIPTEKDVVAFGAQRTAQPWSIYVADSASGKGAAVWTAPSGQGSAYREIVADNQLFWAAGNRIVFAAESDGWTHLYCVPLAGGAATLLTPGDFEVEYVALSADRKTVLFSSNQGDIDRRHVWKAAVDGNRPEALTHSTGMETAPVGASDGRVAVLHSDAQHPLLPAILDGNTIADLAPQAMPSDFPAALLATPQPVLVSASDGMAVHAQLFLPPPGGGKRHPALIFLHGGSRRQMLLGWHYMDYYSNAYAMNQYLASRGYVVLALNYRSGIGYGMKFREALNYGATGASEFHDVVGAGLYLRTRDDVDAQHIGLWGGSYGGYLTALGLARASGLFAAGVDLHGVHDWNGETGPPQFSYDPLAHAAQTRLAWESSPLASVKTWRSPVLLIHGDDDRNVPFAETVDLVQALRRQGVEFEELILPDELHGFLLHRSWLTVYGAAAGFFDRHFK